MLASIKGDPSNIAFNAKYLLEYFSGKEGLILMETSSVSSPARFTHGRSANLVLMPMFVEWGDEPASDEADRPAATRPRARRGHKPAK